MLNQNKQSMYTVDTILDQIKADFLSKKNAYLGRFDCKVSEIETGGNPVIFLHDDGHTLEFDFEGGHYIVSDEPTEKLNWSQQYTIGFKTPKGYISKKSTGVKIANPNDITLEEAVELMAFNTDAVKNTFDPFYAENQARRKSAAGFADVARNRKFSSL